MTPSQAVAMYRRRLDKHGEDIVVRRVNPSPAAPTDRTVRARVMGYQPQEMTGDMNVGDRKVIILAEDLDGSGFPLPLKTGGTDKIVVRGRALNIDIVDTSTRRIGGTLIAYQLRARG